MFGIFKNVMDAANISGGGFLNNLIQITGAVVDRASQYTLFQRTAQWIMPLENPAYDDEMRQAIENTVAHFGKLDILIASAGLSMRAYFEGSSLEAMERVMRVNFFGVLYATHFALPHVKKTRGSLVAISSLTGKRGIPSYGIYGASKFAIQGLYDALRLELMAEGVHVGVVSPAFVDTPLRDNVLGPDGNPWLTPPPPPFRIWPVEKCVDRVIRLIVKRKRQTLMPWFTGPLLALDEMLGRVIGDRILMNRFPRDASS